MSFSRLADDCNIEAVVIISTEERGKGLTNKVGSGGARELQGFGFTRPKKS